MSPKTAPRAAPYEVPTYRLSSPCALGEPLKRGDEVRSVLPAGTQLVVVQGSASARDPFCVDMVLEHDAPATVAGVREAAEAALVFASAEPGRYEVVHPKYAPGGQS